MMFATVSDEVDSKSERSLYGEPQHDVNVENDWEAGYYGEANSREGPEPTEFLSEVEPRGGFDESEGIRQRSSESGERSRARPVGRIVP